MTATIKIHRSLKFFMLALVAIAICVIQSCVEKIDPEDVTEPAQANAGDVITIKLKVTVFGETLGGPSDPKYLYVGFLVPKSWNALRGNNTSLSYTSVKRGNGTFVPLSDAVKVTVTGYTGLTYGTYLSTIYGAGNNFLNDHEWIVYRTDKQYIVASGERIDDIIVTIKTKVGPQALTTKFAYFVNAAGESPAPGEKGNKTLFSNQCFEVVGGTGDLIDFCNKPLASITPLTATDRDLLTFDFDNDLIRTPLTGITDVYVHSEATLTDGTIIKKDQSIDASNLKLVANDQYRLVVYPPTFYGLEKTQSITRIDYWISNQDGTKRTGVAGTDAPFIYKFPICN